VTSGPEYLNDISIRGQGSGRVGFTETATGLYRDGVYSAGGGFGGRTLNRLDLFDAERVEVLRGPQGALFGRNAVGGAVNIISNMPESTVEGRALARYGDPDRLDFEAVISGPIADGIAGRIAGFATNQADGFIFNTTTGNFTDTQDSYGGRAIVEVRPSSNVTLSAIAEYLDSNAAAFTGLARSPALDPSPYVRANQNREGRTAIDEFGITLRADVDLEWGSLSLRAARRERDGSRRNEDDDHFAGISLTDVAPGTAVATPDYSRAQFEDYARNVYQAILASPNDGALKWLVGFEFLESTDNVVTEPESCPAYTGTAQPTTPGCFVGTAAAGATTTFSAAARNAGRGAMNHDTFVEQVESWSIFGALEARLAPRWTVGAELRVQHDKRDYEFERWSEDPLVYFGAGAAPAGLLAPIGGSGATTAQYCPPTLAAPACAAGNETAVVRSNLGDTFFTPALTVRWEVGDRQNVYLRFATAYRSGGFNTNLPPSLNRAQLEPSLRYDPEYAYNYEAGWKGRLLGFNVETAVYYTRTTDVQVVTAPALGATGFVLSNAGNAFVYGFEAELRRVFTIGRGRLVTRIGFSTADGEFEDGASLVAQGATVDLSGRQIPRLRDYQITANLLYTHDFGRFRGFIGVSGQFAGGGFENPDNSRDYAGYDLLDARIGAEGRHWRLSLFARNLNDDQYILNVVGTSEFWSQPRVFGAELTVRY
jgi:outer membrane receptor protein involved in Fe transport